MRVREILSSPAHHVVPSDTLEHAAQLMWEHDCGALPVVDRTGRVGAMITDRDVCMAAYTRGGNLHDLKVSDSMSRTLTSCGPDDDIAVAARLMRQNRIRRLPVVDDQGRPLGVLSLNDLARAAGGDASIATEALHTLSAVCAKGQVPAALIASQLPAVVIANKVAVAPTGS